MRRLGSWKLYTQWWPVGCAQAVSMYSSIGSYDFGPVEEILFRCVDTTLWYERRAFSQALSLEIPFNLPYAAVKYTFKTEPIITFTMRLMNYCIIWIPWAGRCHSGIAWTCISRPVWLQQTTVESEISFANINHHLTQKKKHIIYRQIYTIWYTWLSTEQFIIMPCSNNSNCDAVRGPH